MKNFTDKSFDREKLFQVETDHKPLLAIINQQHLDQCPPSLQRLKFRMIQDHYDVVYVTGKRLTVEDALSRAPIENGDLNLTMS